MSLDNYACRRTIAVMDKQSGGRSRWQRRLAATAIAPVVLYAGIVLTRDKPAARPVPAPSAPTTSTAARKVSPRPAVSPKPLGAAGRGLAPMAAHDAVKALLDARATAVLRRDRAAYARVLDPAATAFRAKQLAVFANLAAVPLATWSYVVDDSQSDDHITDEMRTRYVADEVYAPPVGLRFKLKGFDTHPTELTIRATFVRRGQRWFLASDSDFDKPGHSTARELWDFGPVDVVRTARSLVIGPPGRRAYLQSVARDTDAAIPRVTAFWGKSWLQRVVVLVPVSQRQVSDLVGTHVALGQIAAVAVSQVSGAGGAYRAVGSRIIVNPPNFNRLTALGRRVVVAHEVTHIASRDVTGPDVPAWLVEGFADYVGYRGSPVDPKTAASELGLEVQRRRVPRRLPLEDDFNGDNAKLQQSYESSWLACRMIAERYGEAKLLAFYRAVGTSKAAGKEAAQTAAFRSVLGITPQAFITAWRGYLTTTLS